MNRTFSSIQDIIGRDEGHRGIKDLVIPGDLQQACTILAKLAPSSNVVIVSGFPCCVNHTPPTETDGPPGTCAIARTALNIFHKVTVVTDACNKAVFMAAMTTSLGKWMNDEHLFLDVYPAEQNMTPKDDERLNKLAQSCDLLIACERAGPSQDGHCYTMRAIDMTELGLIAPLHRLVKLSTSPFLAIGDGGNELGMGKVIQKVVNSSEIVNGGKIGCVVPADHLIVASVSNWGGYALAAGTAFVFAHEVYQRDQERTLSDLISEYMRVCLPTEKEETELLQSCCYAGCRDGITGEKQPTVDGMSLETNISYLRKIRETVLLSAARRSPITINNDTGNHDKKFQVKCHCGRVRGCFIFNKPEMTCWECNCSDCNMRQNTHFMVPLSDFELDMEEEEWRRETILYEWGTKVAKRRFCKTCGILPWYTPRSNPDGIGITLPCVIFGENKPVIEVKQFDGIHWEESFAATKISEETKP